MSDSEARLWIDLATGQVDLSGSETFVKEVLPTIREMLSARSVSHEPHNGGREATNHDRRIEDSSDDRATAQRRRRAPSPIHVTPAFVSIDADDKTVSLYDFVQEKLPRQPHKQEELATVYAYYSIKRKGMADVDAPRIMSCYDQLGSRKPVNLRAVLNNIRNRGKWLRNTGNGRFTLTVVGENFVEHDLPKAVKKAKSA